MENYNYFLFPVHAVFLELIIVLYLYLFKFLCSYW